MAFPTGWPPRLPSSVRAIRFYKAGTLTANFSDNAWLFSEGGSATYVPLPFVRPGDLSPVHVGVVGDPLAHPPVPSAPSSPLGGGQNDTGASTPMIWARTIVITAIGGDLQFSFDGETVHGYVASGVRAEYKDRNEAGIAVKGTGTYRVEAW